jgi:uncharacterized membrane protein SpoIIM required for sporulation
VSRSREKFVAERSPSWQELDVLLGTERPLSALAPTDISRVAALYRALCADLMRAQSLGCRPDVIHQLDTLVARAHNALYGPRPYALGLAWDVLARRFPRSLRKNWKFFGAALALFGLPLALGLAGSLRSLDFALSILPRTMLEQMSEAYAEGFDSGRASDVDSAMAGFYVYNNVGIAFRCFATGILFGTGSIFFLVYNGLVIGTVLGHVIRTGSGENILTFICGHAPFELTAIVIAGAAGLRMGLSLVDTGGLTRLASLRRAAPELLDLIVGAAVMLLVAAAIEGFWSPSGVARHIKWSFAGAATLLVTLFLLLGGRRR